MISVKLNHKKTILKLLIVSFTFFFCIGGAFIYYEIDQEVSAEVVQIDDGPLGEKIVDIFARNNSVSFYALTEKGEVYAWGNNKKGELGIGTTEDIVLTGKPKKVLNIEGNRDKQRFLNNIKAIYANNDGSDSESGGVFAYSNDHILYAWGDNSAGTLGLPEQKVYTSPEIVMENVEIKKISISNKKAFLLTENGEVYVTGTATPYGQTKGSLGLGENINKLTEFTRVELDNEGNTIPKISDIYILHEITNTFCERMVCYTVVVVNGEI